jgi:hypothetical protein
LTLSEARLAALVGSGLRPGQAAVKLGITEETARAALKRAFAKVGVSRQSELGLGAKPRRQASDERHYEVVSYWIIGAATFPKIGRAFDPAFPGRVDLPPATRKRLSTS